MGSNGIMRVIGIDPGLRTTGWGIIEAEGQSIRHIANGQITTVTADPLATRLTQLYDGLQAIFTDYAPQFSAIEETFLNSNPQSTLKLGHARGVLMLVPSLAGVPVAEYSPNHIKKSVVGKGKAQKEQVRAMIQYLLPGVELAGMDASDALAVAICHAHKLLTNVAIAGRTRT